MKIKNVHIGYQKSLLEVPELNLETGKVYALIGANGRGKTTLFKTLIGQIPVLSGEISINGNDSSLLSSIDQSKLYGFVNSRFAGIPFMKAKEYVALGRTPYTNALGRLSPADEVIISSSFSLMEIEHLSDKYTEMMSDGERQMLAITKVLAQETKYIFLDEPTAFLDYSNKKKVLELLIKIAKEQNKCIVLSSHDIELAVAFSDALILVPKDKNQVQIIHSTNLNKVIDICF